MQFVFNGKSLSAEELNEIAKKQAKKTPTRSAFVRKVDNHQEATLSYGWVVSGYSPDRWNARVHDYELAKDDHRKAPLKVKSPGSLEDFERTWMKKNKPKKLRSRPYEIESAAKQCAAMAAADGYIHVTVEEILKAEA